MRMVRPDASAGGEIASWLRNLKNLTKQRSTRGPSSAREIPRIRSRPGSSARSSSSASGRSWATCTTATTISCILFLVVALARRLAEGVRRARRADPGAGDLVQGHARRCSCSISSTSGRGGPSAATVLGLGLFLLIVPSLVLGPEFNGDCLATWWHRMLSPFVDEGRRRASRRSTSRWSAS